MADLDPKVDLEECRMIVVFQWPFKSRIASISQMEADSFQAGAEKTLKLRAKPDSMALATQVQNTSDPAQA